MRKIKLLVQFPKTRIGSVDLKIFILGCGFRSLCSGILNACHFTEPTNNKLWHIPVDRRAFFLYDGNIWSAFENIRIWERTNTDENIHAMNSILPINIICFSIILRESLLLANLGESKQNMLEARFFKHTSFKTLLVLVLTVITLYSVSPDRPNDR